MDGPWVSRGFMSNILPNFRGVSEKKQTMNVLRRYVECRVVPREATRAPYVVNFPVLHVRPYRLLRNTLTINWRLSRARGPAANHPTVASQEDLAAKACRGQPMFLPRPPPEWEAAGEAVAVAAAAKVFTSYVQ